MKGFVTAKEGFESWHSKQVTLCLGEKTLYRHFMFSYHIC